MDRTDPRSYGFKSGRVRANGIDIHYASTGDGPPLVLLHGWPEFWLTWKKVMERLAGSFRLIAPDLRGFGDSTKPDASPSDRAGAETHAHDLLGLADALGLDRFGLVGHDVGASVAQAFARAHPERLAGLFFFNCPHPGIGRRWAEAGHLGETWYQYFHQLPWSAAFAGRDRESCRAYVGHFLRHWPRDEHAFDDAFEAWIDNFMKPDNMQGGFNWYVSAQRSRAAAIRGEAPALPPIALPTRVLWGRHDPILKAEWADTLGAHFAAPELGFAEEAGHFVQWESPDEAAAAMGAFFRRVFAA
jgi:pimeloyl-ACP methyl ester carboxylesterase